MRTLAQGIQSELEVELERWRHTCFDEQAKHVETKTEHGAEMEVLKERLQEESKMLTEKIAELANAEGWTSACLCYDIVWFYYYLLSFIFYYH